MELDHVGAWLLKQRVAGMQNRRWPLTEPVETMMVTEYEMTIWPLLLQRVLPMDYNGMPFEARIIGDGKKSYVSSWIDSFGTGIAGIGKQPKRINSLGDRVDLDTDRSHDRHGSRCGRSKPSSRRSIPL